MILNEVKKTDADIELTSGDSRVVLLLEWQGEVRFGPPYYAMWLRIDGRPSPESFAGPGIESPHGALAAFSADGRYLVVERWRRLDYPDTTAVIIDLVTARESVALEIGAGFLRAIRFDGMNNWACTLTTRCFRDNEWVDRHARISASENREWLPIMWWPGSRP